MRDRFLIVGLIAAALVVLITGQLIGQFVVAFWAASTVLLIGAAVVAVRTKRRHTEANGR